MTVVAARQASSFFPRTGIWSQTNQARHVADVTQIKPAHAIAAGSVPSPQAYTPCSMRVSNSLMASIPGVVLIKSIGQHSLSAIAG